MCRLSVLSDIHITRCETASPALLRLKGLEPFPSPDLYQRVGIEPTCLGDCGRNQTCLNGFAIRRMVILPRSQFRYCGQDSNPHQGIPRKGTGIPFAYYITPQSYLVAQSGVEPEILGYEPRVIPFHHRDIVTSEPAQPPCCQHPPDDQPPHRNQPPKRKSKLVPYINPPRFACVVVTPI